MKDTLQCLYNCSSTIINQFYKIIFLETCYRFNVTPKGLRLKKKCHAIRNNDMQQRWDGVLSDAGKVLLKITIEEEVKAMRIEENEFWTALEVVRRADRNIKVVR